MLKSDIFKRTEHAKFTECFKISRRVLAVVVKRNSSQVTFWMQEKWYENQLSGNI